jgi:hypothetical protein
MTRSLECSSNVSDWVEPKFLLRSDRGQAGVERDLRFFIC